jgi:hypothetical protein
LTWYQSGLFPVSSRSRALHRCRRRYTIYNQKPKPVVAAAAAIFVAAASAYNYNPAAAVAMLRHCHCRRLQTLPPLPCLDTATAAIKNPTSSLCRRCRLPLPWHKKRTFLCRKPAAAQKFAKPLPPLPCVHCRCHCRCRRVLKP